MMMDVRWMGITVIVVLAAFGCGRRDAPCTQVAACVHTLCMPTACVPVDGGGASLPRASSRNPFRLDLDGYPEADIQTPRVEKASNPFLVDPERLAGKDRHYALGFVAGWVSVIFSESFAETLLQHPSVTAVTLGEVKVNLEGSKLAEMSKIQWMRFEDGERDGFREAQEIIQRYRAMIPPEINYAILLMEAIEDAAESFDPAAAVH